MLTEAVVMNWLSNGARPNGDTAHTLLPASSSGVCNKAAVCPSVGTR